MAVGRVLSGRYQIEELLGSGGMATVWRGRDLRLARPVAIKELPGPWLADRAVLERFDREARTAARLAHPNIVAVHDVGVDGSSRYLVMELIEGPTVAAMLADGPLPVAQAVAIAVQACDGLAAAHAAGIIHRDVKPANLMLTPAGVVKICDFGIARALKGATDTSLTGAAFAMGSSKYMAPEQAYGDHVDDRADLYSLGCTMYAMLTGSAPFSGENAIAILHQHLTQPPAPLHEHRADVPRALEQLVTQLLEKDPAARPADADEVKARLLALSQDPAPAAVPVAAGAMVALPSESAAELPRPAAPATSSLPGVAYQAGTNGPSHPTTSHRWRWAAAIAALAVGVVLAAILAAPLVDSRPESGEVAGPSATSAAVADTPATGPVTTSPTAQAVTRPSASIQPRRPASPAGGVGQPTTAQTPPADPVVALRLSIQQQVETGNLNPDLASDLYKKVDEIAREMNAGDTEDAAKRIQELRAKLDTLLNDGRLSASGYDILSRDLDRVAATLP
ncbi:MAG TPA: protein kinase [Micromonosporaceae bacterium]|nr:protein kinase [Micromonosporaceae bacterium]